MGNSSGSFSDEMLANRRELGIIAIEDRRQNTEDRSLPAEGGTEDGRQNSDLGPPISDLLAY